MAEATLFEHLFVLYKRRFSVLVIVVVSATTAFLLGHFMAPVYEAKAVFFVPVSTGGLSELAESRSGSGNTGSLLPPTDEELMGPYFGLLKSRKMAELVHRDFPQKRVEKLLLSDMSFELTDEFLITVFSRDRDPKLAADIANAYAHYLNEILEDPATEAIRSDMIVLKSSIQRTVKELATARHRLIEFEANYSDLLLNEEIRLLTSHRSMVLNQLGVADTEVAGSRARISAVTEELKQEGVLVGDHPARLESSRAVGLKQEMAELELTRIGAGASSRAASEERDLADQRLPEAQALLREEFEGLLASRVGESGPGHEQLLRELVDLYVEEAGLQAASSALGRTLGEIEERRASLSNVKVEWTSLTEGVERLRLRYNALELSLQEAEFEDALALHAVVPVDRASTPQGPVFPVPGINLAVAAISGLLFGIVYAFAAEGLAYSGRARKRIIIKEILRER